MLNDGYTARAEAWEKVEKAFHEVAEAGIPPDTDIRSNFTGLTSSQRRAVLNALTAMVGVAMLESEIARREKRAPAWAAHQLAQRRN